MRRYNKLLTASEDTAAGAEGASAGAGSNVSWIFKNKDHGKMSAAASLGSILLWDVEDGLPRVDNYLYSMEHQVGPATYCSLHHTRGMTFDAIN